MSRRVNAAGVDLIAGFEGLRLTAYLCPAGVPTIGYGHTRTVAAGDVGRRTITEAGARELLRADLRTYAAAVEAALGAVPASDNQFAAMVSLAFNVGAGAFAGSSVVRHHRAGNQTAAAGAFRLWNKATVAGRLQELPGLTRRRAAEAALYLTPDHPEAEAMPQAIAAPVGAARSKTLGVAGFAAVSGAGALADQAREIADAVQQVTAAASSASGTLAAVQAAGAAFVGGSGLRLALTLAALLAVAFVGWRYWAKVRAGDVRVR